MKSEDAIQNLTLFFNDIIGAVIPGALLGVGLIVIHVGTLSKIQFDVFNNGYAWCLALAFAFGCGHLISSLHGKIVERACQKIRLLPTLTSVQHEIEGSNSYRAFKVAATDQARKQSLPFTFEDWKFNELRNLAMSVSPEAPAIGRRFMFISLLCSGIGVASLLITLDFLCFSIFFPSAMFHYEHVPAAWIQIGIMLGATSLCLGRSADFYKRALSAPFSIALGSMLFGEKKEKMDETV